MIKGALNILRTILYIFLCYLSINLFFYLFNYLFQYLTETAFSIYDQISHFWFWVLMLVVGFAIIGTFFGILNWFTLLLKILIDKICPYKLFAVIINALITLIFFLYYSYYIISTEGNFSNFTMGSLSIIFLIMLLSFSIQIMVTTSFNKVEAE